MTMAEAGSRSRSLQAAQPRRPRRSVLVSVVGADVVHEASPTASSITELRGIVADGVAAAAPYLPGRGRSGARQAARRRGVQTVFRTRGVRSRSP
jgi:hypothetical protein